MAPGTSSLQGTHPIDTFEFADGTILTFSQLATAGIGISGGALNDFLEGTAQGERIFGGAGSDTIQGQDEGPIVLLAKMGRISLKAELTTMCSPVARAMIRCSVEWEMISW